MAKRTFSLMMSTERGFLQDDITDWIGDSFNLLNSEASYQTLAVTYYSTHEIVYGQINSENISRNINQNQIIDALLSLPREINILNFTETEFKDNISVIRN